MTYAKQICPLCVVPGPRLFITIPLIQVSMVKGGHDVVIKMSAHGLPTTVDGKRCAVILGNGNGTIYVAEI